MKINETQMPIISQPTLSPTKTEPSAYPSKFPSWSPLRTGETREPTVSRIPSFYPTNLPTLSPLRNIETRIPTVSQQTSLESPSRKPTTSPGSIDNPTHVNVHIDVSWKYLWKPEIEI